MAKGARNYKEEYRKRIERGLKRGKTRQQARGHVAKEHIRRAEREIEEAGLTKAQIRIVFNWASHRLFEIKDSETNPEEVLAWAQMDGYEAFKQYRKIWDAARRTYLKEVRRGTYASRGMPYLEYLATEAGGLDLSWLYYH